MRISTLLTGALALCANALPELSGREYPCKACKDALTNCPQAKADCASILRATVTPHAKTVTKTVTAKKTITKPVTKTVATVTNMNVKTVTTATSTTEIWLNASPRAVEEEREVENLPRGQTNVPDYARKGCKDSKQYAAACTALGFKPSTTTLPARTVTETKTVSLIFTAAPVIPATETVQRSSTEVDASVATEIVYLLPGCQGPGLYSDNYGTVVISPMGDENVVRFTGTVDNSPLYNFALTDDRSSSGYLVATADSTTFYLTYLSSSTSTKSLDSSVQVVEFTTDFGDKTKQNLVCLQARGSGSGGPVTCKSKIQPELDTFFYCQWPDGVSASSLALGPSGHSSQYCSPVTININGCGQK